MLTDISSHVEKKLRLYFIAKKYIEHTKKTDDLEVILKNILDLRKFYLSHTIVAEIKINRKPCSHCEKFRERVEQASGFEFVYTHMLTLGECELDTGGTYGSGGFGRHAMEVLSFSDDESDELPDSGAKT